MMRKRVKRREYGLFFVLCLLLCLLTGAGYVMAAAEEAHLYDSAGLFSEEEKTEIEEALARGIEQTGMDFVVVTTEDAHGKTAEEYGEDFYIDNDFGFDEEYSGMLFLIDMDNREIFYTPVGKMNYYVTDSRRDRILDDAFRYVADGEFGKAALLAVKDTISYYEKGVDKEVYPHQNAAGESPVPVYPKPVLTPEEILIAFAAAAIVAFVPCAAIAAQYRTKKNSGAVSGFQNAYRAQSHFIMAGSRDQYLGHHVTSVRIRKDPPPSSGSSSSGAGSSGGYHGNNVHTSSGRTFNGGSRKF